MSHRQAKRLRRAKRSEPTKLALEYYTVPFLALHAQLDVQSIPRPHPIRARFWQLIPQGNYAGLQARDLVNRYLESVERELKEQLRGSSIAYLLHLYRRLSPGPAGENDTAVTIAITRASLEAACQKYGQVELCGRVANSDTVPREAILRGEFAKHNTIAQLPPQLVLTDFGLNELKQFYSTEHLAYEVWKAMATLRSLGKGCGLSVTAYDFHDTRSDELDFLISKYDDREREFLSSATGTVFDSRSRKDEGWILLPSLNSARTPISVFVPMLRDIYGYEIESTIQKSELISNFIWHPFNIRAYWQAHEPFAPAFFDKHQCHLKLVLAICGALASQAISTWKTFEGWWHLWQRAYTGPARVSLVLDVLKEALPHAYSILGLSASPEESEFETAVRFLSLPPNRDAISIGSHGPHAAFLPCGDERIFIDYAFIEQRLFWLFYDINPPDQNFKGSALESYVRDRPSVLPIKPCKASDGSSKQIDASFGAGRVLIIVECKVKARSFGFERGDPEAIGQRTAFIDESLHQVDEKALWLAHRPVGRNYDVSGFDWILPLVVTPFVEFIHLKDRYHWINEATPRVISPWELQTALADGLLEQVAPYYQFAVQVQR